jgi:hypothetical protein
MLSVFDAYGSLFKSWRVTWYEQEGDAYALHISGPLQDESRLEIRDYVFPGGSRRYAYQWMDAAGAFRRRWDNAPYWPTLATAPHHVHVADQAMPEASTVTNIEDLLRWLQEWFGEM